MDYKQKMSGPFFDRIVFTCLSCIFNVIRILFCFLWQVNPRDNKLLFEVFDENRVVS